MPMRTPEFYPISPIPVCDLPLLICIRLLQCLHIKERIKVPKMYMWRAEVLLFLHLGEPAQVREIRKHRKF